MRSLRGLLLAPLAAPFGVLPQGADVPLERYTDPRWPTGVMIGETRGAAFLDYDRDGWVDLYSHSSGKLWHNEKGRTWTRTADLDLFLPPIVFRYGSSCADYDNDGLPDIATEQRGDCFYLLKNLGGASFLEVASDPSIVLGQPCGMFAETACWADVDDDGDLDLFVPAYPDTVAAGSGGNRFWENLGPSGPNGTHQLLLNTVAAGLEIPPGVERPEGAQFCDVDRDGDVDLFVNHTLYQNRSQGCPSFVALGEGSTGVGFAAELDEGVAFFDHDLDGDQDLIVLYSLSETRLWENRGDGTFSPAAGALESPALGVIQGLSAEDWDQDGDLDLATSTVFRRNLLVETGKPYLRLASHTVPSPNSSVAWGDWDRDGDPDGAFVSPGIRAHLYRNTTYGGDTRSTGNRSIRVSVVRDAPALPRGLETEFGATVELRVHGDPSGFVRRRFVASSHGYLQQSEYALTLALPPGPDPHAPALGVYFDLAVDFPGQPENGILRVDPSVNPALRRIPLGRLDSREITVFRSGKVVLDGVERPPRPAFAPRLTTAGGGPAHATPESPLPDPVPAPAPSWFAGLELDTSAATGRLRVEELVLDGQLDLPAACAFGGFNAAVWDVTDPGAPSRTWQATLATQARNRRHFLPVAFELDPARRYRFVCRVTELRASPLASPGGDEPLRIEGGLSFRDDDPCSGAQVLSAGLDPARASAWLRFRAPIASARSPADVAR